MKQISSSKWAALCAAVLFGALLAPRASAAQTEPPYKDSPDPSKPHWVRLPDAKEIDSFYPAQAEKKAYGGKAILRCNVNAAQQLEDCEVLYANPPDVGFGEAALKLSILFKIDPGAGAKKKPSIVIPVNFASHGYILSAPSASADMKAVATAVDPSVGLPIREPVFDFESERFLFLPYYAQEYRVSGAAVLSCLASPAGKISGCSLIFEAPKHWGFGDAGLALANSGLLQVKPVPDASGDQLARVIVRFPKLSARRTGECCNADGSLIH